MEIRFIFTWFEVLTPKSRRFTQTCHWRKASAMSVFIVCVLILHHGVILRACSSFCPSSCMCTQEKRCTVLCDRTNMAELPAEFPCETSSINLQKNQLKFLSERAFGTLPSLKSLFLDHNNISFITPGAFKGLPNLQELTMAHNKDIRYLHTRTFTSLRRLVRLDLSGCNLFSIPDRIFLEQMSLAELFCFQNKFRRIPSAIRGMENLTHVYLERNKIEAVAYNSLLGLCNLKYLNLQENRISVLHHEAFKDLTQLQNFYLNDNLLADLPTNSFKGLCHLKMLNLGGNLLSNISNTWFGDLVELEVLYLDRNCLSFIDHGAFHNLTSLMTLHLNSNKLTTLPLSIFQPSYFMGRLYLFRNPWDCSCELEWLKDWMENYRLVRDVPCASPPSVSGLDLSMVLFTRINGSCIDPAVLNPTPSGPDYSSRPSRFNSLISKLISQELWEERRHVAEAQTNETLIKAADVQLSAARRSCSVGVVLLLFLLLIQKALRLFEVLMEVWIMSG